MRSTLLYCIMLFVCCAVASAQPKIASPEPVHDFGKRLITESIDHAFVIQNQGDAPLELTGFKYTCGCTVASMEDEVIAPGGETIVHGHLNFMGTGPVRKELLLLSNDPSQPQFPLYFEGEALPVIKITPEMKRLGDVLDDACFEQPITLAAGADEVEFRIAGEITSTVDWFAFDVEETVPGKEYRVIPRIVRRPPPGVITLRIVIPTDHPELPSVHAQLSANVVGDYDVVPSVLRYVHNENAAPRSFEFSVSEGRLGEFEILEAVGPADGVNIKLNKSENALQYYVVVENFPVNSLDLSGKEIVLKTNLDIPVRVPIQAIRN